MARTPEAHRGCWCDVVDSRVSTRPRFPSHAYDAVPGRVCRGERAKGLGKDGHGGRPDPTKYARRSLAKGDSSSSSTSTATGSVVPFSYLINVSSPSL
jgi:hypothetical protein